jgi:hypothetical protein
MTRPSIITYAFGNALSVTVLFAATCYLGYQWYTGAASSFFAVAVALATASAMNANSRLAKYRDWKREWDAMDGRPAAGGRFAMSSRTLRVLMAIPVWCLFAYLVLNNGASPLDHVATGLFWLMTAVIVVGSIVQWWRSRWARIRPRVSKDVPVTLCVKSAGQSGNLADAYRALPDYCASLLRDR